MLPRRMSLRLPDPSPGKLCSSSSQCSRNTSTLADSVPLSLALSGQWLGSPTLQGLTRPRVFAQSWSRVRHWIATPQPQAYVGTYR